MKVLVDTSIWSLALRRRKPSSPEVAELSRLIEEGLVEMIGPIRQEILSGISQARQFELLKSELSSFEDLSLARRHFETAAEFYNQCRKHGIQGSHTDFLICSVASHENLAVFTIDRDFVAYSKWLPMALHPLQKILRLFGDFKKSHTG